MKFHLSVETGSNILNVKSLQVIGEYSRRMLNRWIFTLMLQKHSVIVSIKKLMTRRGQFRNLKITLDLDLAKVYLDEDLNVKFGSFHLQEMVVGVEAAWPLVESKQADKKKTYVTANHEGYGLQKVRGEGYNAECQGMVEII